MPNIQTKYQLNPVRVHSVGLAPYPYTINSSSAIGIEVEVENVSGVNLPRNTVWAVVTDGSLRNNGMEFVSAPIAASEAPAAIHQLMVDTLNAQCHFSQRTSVHIHLNVQDMEAHQVVDLVMLYSLFEKLLYKFTGRGRIKNIYCVPITETSLLTGFQETGIEGRWYKYTGLNLIPIFGEPRGEGRGFGTIEFRHMHGTPSVDKLCMWIDMITSMKEYVMKSTTKELRNFFASMDEDYPYEKLLVDVFGKNASALKYEGFDEIKSCYMAVKSALTSNKTLERVMARASSDAPFYQFKG